MTNKFNFTVSASSSEGPRTTVAMLFGIMVGLVLWFLIPSIILAVRNYPDGLDYVASFANLNLPVMTFATLILIIATFQAQSRANYLSSVDAHFFELAKMHRDIFADIQHWKAGSRNVAPVHKGVEAMQLVSQQTVRTFDVVRHTVVDIEDESERTRLACAYQVSSSIMESAPRVR